MNTLTTTDYIDEHTFHTDVQYIEALWQRTPVGNVDLPLIDFGEGEPLVFVPILEHLEWVYARQVRSFSRSRRVIMYRRQENRASFVGLAERAAELLRVLDSLGLGQVDLVGHGDAAMVLFEFAIRHPERCRSLVIISQAADYQIAPHPFIWLLHELFLRLPVEHLLPAWFLRRIVINYIMSALPPSPSSPSSSPSPSSDSPSDSSQLPRYLVEEQFEKISSWPAIYKFSVLPIIHYFDVRQQLERLTMPVLLINRFDDALSPEVKTRWLAQHLPACAGYHLIAGRERFFMYARAEQVNQFIQTFLASERHYTSPA